jgi:hypothetical protein
MSQVKLQIRMVDIRAANNTRSRSCFFICLIDHLCLWDTAASNVLFVLVARGTGRDGATIVLDILMLLVFLP